MEHPPLQSTPAGAFRFNTDTRKLEYYDGNQWVNVTSTSPEARTGGGRGLFGGGCTSPGGSDDRHVNTIDYITISTKGNALEFGELHARRDFVASCASKTRAFWAGGVDPGTGGINEVDSVTIASRGNAVDFSENINHRGGGGLSDQTRAIFPSVNGGTNVINYFTMATTGTVEDFGDAYVAAASGGSLASPTRGVSGGGDSPAYTNVIQYLTIQTKGNTADFGDLTVARGYTVGASSATRGLFMTGYNNTSGSNTNIIEYITTATLGNAIDFGDTSVAARHAAGTSDCRRAIITAGYPGFAGTIGCVQIATKGSADDFGNQFQTRRGMAGSSNAHGGLG